MAGGRSRVIRVVHVVRVLVSWRALRYSGAMSSARGGKQAGGRGNVIRVVRAGSVLIAGRLVRRSERAGRHHPCRDGKQASKRAGVFSRNMRCRPFFARLWNISSIYGYRRVLIIPRVPLAFFSLISKLGRSRPRYIVVRRPPASFHLSALPARRSACLIVPSPRFSSSRSGMGRSVGQ